jgi:EmrB/QacA subfamily drug resistance transporter
VTDLHESSNRTNDAMPTGGASAETDGAARYRWIAMAIVLIGTFMVILDTSIVNVALPQIGADFHTISGVEWIVTAYLLAVGVSMMATGWFADRFGRKWVFVISLALFTAGSLLCALSPNLEFLVLFRVLQGVGGGALMPLAMAMIYELFEPTERGRALGYFGIAAMAAPAIGPVLGGTVVSSVGWRWLFLINVPIGLVGVPVAVRLLRDTGYREARPFDRFGLATAGTGLVALLIGLQQGGSWGWTSVAVVALLGAGAVLFTVFTVHSLRHQAPLVDMRLFANPVFALSMVAIALMTVAQYSRLVYIPLELGSTRGIDELKIGLVMLPAALGVAITMPIGGWLTDRVGSRLPYTSGVVVLFAAYWSLAHLTADTDLVWVALALLVGGLGAGLGLMAPNVVAMNSVTASHVGQAAGLSSVSRQVSAAFGTAVLASIFASVLPAEQGAGGASLDDSIAAYNTIFRAVLYVLAVAAFVGLWLPGRRRALELQRERSIERERLIESGALVDDAAGMSPALDH